MPTYEFKCRKCRKAFEVNASPTRLKSVKCPKCGGKDIERLYERFTAITGKKS